jgi:broad specificity phosphatase PhoE
VATVGCRRRGSLDAVETVFLARHGESRFSVRGAVNGDPEACGGLTDAGREQARSLGRALAPETLELCVHTEFQRTLETAELALTGRDVPRLVVPELNDIRVGDYEGRLLDDYRSWAWCAEPSADCPGGGESRAAVAERYAAGFRAVLARTERTALVVAHALPIRYVLDAIAGRDPARRVAAVEYARPVTVAAPELARAVDRREAWCRRPVFA